MTQPDQRTRPYNSPQRRAQSAETRERILAAAHALLHASSVRDWQTLTIRAVAQKAGVSERTVYRHFCDERGLRDALMLRLEEEAGIDLRDLRLHDIADVAARIFGHVSSYPSPSRPPMDPTLNEAKFRQREALHDALDPWTQSWPARAAGAITALFDLLWSVGSYERLTSEWQLSHQDAVLTLTWAIGLVDEAVRAGHRPPTEDDETEGR